MDEKQSATCSARRLKSAIQSRLEMKEKSDEKAACYRFEVNGYTGSHPLDELEGMDAQGLKSILPTIAVTPFFHELRFTTHSCIAGRAVQTAQCRLDRGDKNIGIHSGPPESSAVRIFRLNIGHGLGTGAFGQGMFMIPAQGKITA